MRIGAGITPYNLALAVIVAGSLGCPLPVEGQQRAERFPLRESATPVASAVEAASYDDRKNYWIEGAVIGAVAGVVAGVLLIDPGGMCTLSVPGECSDDYTPVVIGSVLQGILGAVLGGMIGYTIPRR